MGLRMDARLMVAELCVRLFQHIQVKEEARARAVEQEQKKWH